jgi:hypothetical protein
MAQETELDSLIADSSTTTPQMRNPDGSWLQFLTMHYRRVQ